MSLFAVTQASSPLITSSWSVSTQPSLPVSVATVW
jgi:hypothetical protein